MLSLGQIHPPQKYTLLSNGTFALVGSCTVEQEGPDQLPCVGQGSCWGGPSAPVFQAAPDMLPP